MQIDDAKFEAELRYQFEEGHRMARERGRVLMLLASLVSFFAGAVLF